MNKKMQDIIPFIIASAAIILFTIYLMPSLYHLVSLNITGEFEILSRVAPLGIISAGIGIAIHNITKFVLKLYKRLNE